jgi:DNA-binding transcriptional LysR family regulator
MPKHASLAHVSRRLRFRDLQTFLAVAQCGSMAKAAGELGITQPAVSDIIADLEGMFAVKLFDRTPRGVEPTVYGRAMLTRARAAFDEVRQGIRDMELLADPTAGELKIGCPASVAAAVLPAIIERFGRLYPRVVMHFDDVPAPSTEFPGLLERRHDLVLARIVRPLVDERDLNIEILFEDPLVVAADTQSQWARRRKIDLPEIVGASWILTAPDTWVYRSVAEAFHERGLSLPRISLVAPSALLRANLLCNGPFVTALPSSVLRLGTGSRSLKALPIGLHIRGYPLAVLTLKNRALNPLVTLFIDHLREVARSMPTRSRDGVALTR